MSAAIVTRVIERLADTLEQTLVPDLNSEYTRQQALAAAGLLRVLAPIIEVRYEVIADENNAISSLLEKVSGHLASPLSGPHATELAEKISQYLHHPSRDLADHFTDNVQLKKLLSSAIGEFDTLRSRLAAETFTELESDLHSLLRAQLSAGISHWVGFLDDTEALHND